LLNPKLVQVAKKCDKTIGCVQNLVKENVPIMGICLGDQILALTSASRNTSLKTRNYRIKANSADKIAGEVMKAL